METIIWILAGCFLGIFTGLMPGIHINTVAAFAAMPEAPNGIGIALMIASMSIVHCFVDFIPSILLAAPEESNFLAVLPGHRMLLKGQGFLALRLTMLGAFFSGIIALAIAPIFIVFVEKSTGYFAKIIPFFLMIVLATMVFGEKNNSKKIWACTIIALSAMLGIIALGEKSTIANPLLVCITGFFGAATIIESLRKKSIFPEQKLEKTRIKKSIVLEGSLLGFLGGCLTSIIPSIGSNQAAFMLKKVFGNMTTKKFLVLLGGSNTANMFLGFLVLFAWGKTRSGSSAAISLLIEPNTENIMLISIACLFALGFGFAAATIIAKFFIKKIQKFDYKKINLGILALLAVLVAALSNPAGIIAFLSATAIGLLAVSKSVKRTNCMAFLMIPALIFYLGF